MKFSDINYNRIDFDNVKKDYEKILDKMNHAKDFVEFDELIKKLNIVRNNVDTMKTLASIKFSINTQDEYFKAENEFWDEYLPKFSGLDIKFYKTLLESSFKEEIIKKYKSQFYNLISLKVESFSEEIVPYLQKENTLISEYTSLLSSANIEFEGRVCNLSDMSAYMESPDKETRHEAIRRHTDFFAQNEEKFDRIFDELVKVRTQMAKKLGYKNFVELGYKRMNRVDYTESDIKNLRKLILERYLPEAQKIYAEQEKRIGVKKISYYDESLLFLDGNPSLKLDEEEIFLNGVKMYKELSEETGEFFEFLLKNELFDVRPRKNKSMGGYCTMLPSFKIPFIFGNFNQTVDDIDLLTHETGHAFQMYMSREIEMPELVFPTLDSCEIHSMSMEFFTYPWMENFFGKDSEKYKKYHFESAIKFLPYGTMVDHFQHIVYENPQLSSSDRKDVWRKLEKIYLPHREYDDLDILERGGYWYRQGHIFKDPFYYIDYVLAEICALQFFELMKKDYKESWERFLKICKVGGTISFSEIVSLAGLKNPIENNMTDMK